MNNKMNINDIYDAVADIHNSIYNLRKNDKVTFEDYMVIADICSQMERAVRYAISNNLEIERFFQKEKEQKCI